MSPFAYLWRSIRPRVTNSGSLQVCTGTTGHAEACKFEYDPEKLDFGDMASFDFISTVCYKHALQVSHVDLTDSGVLACAFTKLKEWLVTDPQRTLGLCSACTGGTTLLPIGLVVNPAVMVYAGGVLLQDP